MAVPSAGVAARRFPLVPVILCTLLAFASAVGVYTAFGPDDSDAEVTDDTLELQPTGELPASVEEVRLTGLGGAESQTLGDYVGDKPVVLNFFASWCVPCLDEMPAFEAVHQQLGDQVNFVGLANLDSEDKALEIAVTKGSAQVATQAGERTVPAPYGGSWRRSEPRCSRSWLARR